MTKITGIAFSGWVMVATLNPRDRQPNAQNDRGSIPRSEFYSELESPPNYLFQKYRTIVEN